MASADAAPSTPTATTGAAGEDKHSYPYGHLGYLTAEEEAALKAFKELLLENGLWKAGPPPSHDDQTLLRFLRARKWVVPDAFKQFKDTEEWRAVNDLDLLYDTIDIAGYEQTRQMYPQWTGRRDKRGIPLFLYEIRYLDSKTVSEYEKSSGNTFSKANPDGATPAPLLRLFALYDNLTRFTQPLCTEMTDRPHNDTPITLSNNIVDVSGVSLRQFWNLKSHMQAASQLATAHYPETLDRIFIIGAPYFFSTVWGWIKRWFDPVTVSKIFILSSSEVLPTLQAYIEMDNIPKQYGGNLEFKRGDAPNLDPAIRASVTWSAGHEGKFPPGPVYWRPLGVDRMECIAVGSLDKADRKERVGTIARHSQAQLAVVVEAEGIVTTVGTPAEGFAQEQKQLGGAPAPVAPVVAAAEGVAPAEAQQAVPVIVTAPDAEKVPSQEPATVLAGVENLSLADPAQTKKEGAVAA